MPNQNSLSQQAVNTIRFLAIDGVQKANSGHPGAPMGMAPMAYVLWTRHLKHNPADPAWPDRDRFVLSAGHASMLLYSLLHLTGYDLPLSELQPAGPPARPWLASPARRICVPSSTPAGTLTVMRRVA